ncbi:MAG: VOC family protein [Acidimicrobiales bacterium]
MEIQMRTVLYPVQDIDKAKVTFTALFGAEPHVDSPYYVGFSVDGLEIGLVANGHAQGMSGPEPYYDVVDITATLAALQSAGADIVQQPKDVGAGLLVAKVRDTEGNMIGVKQVPTSA